MKRFTYILFILCCLYSCKTQQPTTGTQFAADVQRDMPFKTSELKVVNEHTYSFRCDNYVDLLPDYEVDLEAHVWSIERPLCPRMTSNRPMSSGVISSLTVRRNVYCVSTGLSRTERLLVMSILCRLRRNNIATAAIGM